jgi:hypothetical protein
MIGMNAGVVLLPAFTSLVEPVKPVNVTLVGAVSAPPGLPGVVYDTVQVMDPPTAISEPTGGAHPVTATGTGLLALSTAVALQVAAVAEPPPVGDMTLVQVIVPVTVLPGADAAGKPENVGVMSAGVAATVIVAVSHTEPFGVGAQTL